MKTMDKSIEPFIFAHATKTDNAKLIVFFLMGIIHPIVLFYIV